MKNNYFKSTLLVLAATFLSLNLLAGDKCKVYSEKNKNDELNRSGPVQPPSMQAFGPDVVIRPETEQQHDLKIATAFNGWNYASFTYQDGNGNSGFAILKSLDHGQSWDTITKITAHDSVYYTSDIIVCGDDTNSLFVFFGSVLYTPADGNHQFFVDRYNATDNLFISRGVQDDNGTDSIYDVALSHDFLHPSSVSLTFSVEAIYSKHGAGMDSIIALLSIYNGGLFNDRKTVDTTSTSLFGKVSISYAYSSFGHPNGRYMVAYEEHDISSVDGHIKLSATEDDVTGLFLLPLYLDSLDATWINHGSNPSISCQNSLQNNDSSGLSGVVVWESNINGSGNYDVVGAYNYDAVTNPWNACWVDSSSSTNAKQPDIAYEETLDNFHVTYWASTENKLKYVTQGFNFPAPSAWTTVSLQYNDQVGTLISPHPQVVIDPSFDQANFAWIESRGLYSQAIFDAENSFVQVQETGKIHFSIEQNFPNPATDFTTIRFELTEQEQVSLEIYDIVGNRISTLEKNSPGAGIQEFHVDVRQWPAGYYTYSLRVGLEQYSKKLLVIH